MVFATNLETLWANAPQGFDVRHVSQTEAGEFAKKSESVNAYPGYADFALYFAERLGIGVRANAYSDAPTIKSGDEVIVIHNDPAILPTGQTLPADNEPAWLIATVK